MLRFVIILGIVLPAVFGQLAVEQCAGLRPLPSSVIVPGCTVLPCNVQAGGLAEVEISFNVNEYTDYINPSIFADLGDDERIYFEIPEEYQDGCGQLTVGSCPLAEGASATYRFAVPFSGSELGAGSSVTIQFTLYDDDENTLACFRAGINIV